MAKRKVTWLIILFILFNFIGLALGEKVIVEDEEGNIIESYEKNLYETVEQAEERYDSKTSKTDITNPKQCGLMCNREWVHGTSVRCEEYEIGITLDKKMFCWSINNAYCQYDCVNETNNLLQEKICPDLSDFEFSCIRNPEQPENWCDISTHWHYYSGSKQLTEEEISCAIIVKPINEGQQVCGDGVCEDIEKKLWCPYTYETRLMIEKYGLGEKNYTERLQESCYPICYKDCGPIVRNSGLSKPSYLIEIPFSAIGASTKGIELEEGECTKPTPVINDNGSWNENKGDLCLMEVTNEGANLTYKGESFFLKYYELYNYRVLTSGDEPREVYLYLTYDSLLEIYKPSNVFKVYFIGWLKKLIGY
jgi:hypothetical protein